MSFTAGFAQAATFGGVTLNITEHNLEEEVNRLLTTHSGTSGKATCIAGVLDFQGTITANVDAANLPNVAAGVTAGAKGTVTFSVGPVTNQWSVTAMITRVNWKSAVNGLVSYNFNVVLDATGTYQRPS